MVGLVLGVVRLPFILFSGLSVPESIVTNIGISTLVAITAAIQQHLKSKNVSFTTFIIMSIQVHLLALY